jgi:hypothetical protein
VIGEPIAKERIFVGRDSKGSRLFLEIALRRTDTPAPYQNVNHGAQRHIVELTISGEEYLPGDRRDDPSGGGQITGTFLAFIDDPEAKLEYPRAELREVYEIWKRWHLNGMNAACAHMPADAHEKWLAGEQVECPKTGYKYGSAWLSEPLPDYVYDTLRAVFQMEIPDVNPQGVPRQEEESK